MELRKILTLLLLLITGIAFGQTPTIYSLRYDTVKVEKTTGTGNAELMIKNQQRGVTNGIAYNRGNGWLGFKTLTESDIPSLSIIKTTGLQSALDGKISGSGTLGFIPKFTSSTSVGNSALYEDENGNIGVGLSTLTGAKLEIAGGVIVDGSYSGYSGAEVILNGTGLDDAFSTIGTGARIMSFDHRGVSNTGSFRWRNGTGAASNLMTLSPIGNLTITGTASVATPTASGHATTKAYVDNLVVAGSSTVLKDFYTDAPSVGSTETDLFSYTIPANRLDAAGEKITAEFSGNITTGATAIKIYWGALVLLNKSIPATSGSWKATVTIIEVNSSSLKSIVTLNYGDKADVVYSGNSTNFGSDNIVKITGTGAANGDVVGRLGTISWHAAAP